MAADERERTEKRSIRFSVVFQSGLRRHAYDRQANGGRISGSQRR